MDEVNLTDPERRLVAHLRSLRGRSASYRELAESLGWASVRAVGYHAENLERKGIVVRGAHRGLRLVDPPGALPILGEVAAGEPVFAGDEMEWFDFEKVFRAEDVFLLRVRGDSMIEEHIANGDLVAVQRNPEVEDGRIVVVRIDGAHTLKKIRLQGNRVVLYPRNRKYSAREVQPYEDAEVIGGFIGVIRTLKQPKK